jgi:uncharacterized protein (DUF433 family)
MYICIQIIVLMVDWKEYITITPGVRSGKPCIKGSRITVQDVLRKLASDMSIEELIEDFPELNKEKILAAISFASQREQAIEYFIAV